MAWCAVYEREVKQYVKKSHNCKGIEVTFAHSESRRDFLKPFQETVQQEKGKINPELVNKNNLPTCYMHVTHKFHKSCDSYLFDSILDNSPTPCPSISNFKLFWLMTDNFNPVNSRQIYSG